MTKDDIANEQSSMRWYIDSEWYPQHGRSISILLKSCLCQECRKKLDEEGSQASDTKLTKRIRECCGRSPDFITGQTPIMESIFRFFIASGNEPVTVEKLGKRLSEWRGGDISRTSPEALLRLLKNDRYYGFHPAAD
jgi:hypothetical protein